MAMGTFKRKREGGVVPPLLEIRVTQVPGFWARFPRTMKGLAIGDLPIMGTKRGTMPRPCHVDIYIKKLVRKNGGHPIRQFIGGL